MTATTDNVAKPMRLDRLPKLIDDPRHFTADEVTEIIDFANDGLLEKFHDASPVQVAAWFDANVTDLPSALIHLKRLTRLAHYLLRRQCRRR